MSKSEKPVVPDLKSLLAEASRASSKVTVPLKQGLREQIEAAEAELAELAADAKPARMGAKSPVKEKAEEIEALRAEMAASALTFHFQALSAQDRVDIRHAMQGRDSEDELNLRAIAAMCTKVVAADGTRFPERMTWQDFDALRDSIGAATFDLTIDAASNRAGGGDWSVPFSPNASHILGTVR